MKSLHSEEFYKENWDRFIKEVPGVDYINLEKELARELAIFAELPAEALEILKAQKAQEIAKRCLTLVKAEMVTAQGIDRGEVSFGYTTMGQEVRARREFRTRFEFNCLQLKVFKEKYGVSI